MEVFFPSLGSVFPSPPGAGTRGHVPAGEHTLAGDETPMIKDTYTVLADSPRDPDRGSRWHGDCTWVSCLNRSPNGAMPRGASTESSMRVGYRAGRAAALLSLIGLIMAPTTVTAQQGRPRATPQPRIPVRVVTSSDSPIFVHVADRETPLPNQRAEDRVFITNTPGSPLVTSVAPPPARIADRPHDGIAGMVSGRAASWMADDGVAWLPQQDGQWRAPSGRASDTEPRPTDVAELAGVRAYLSSAAGDPPVASALALPAPTARNRQLPRHASMSQVSSSQGRLVQGHRPV